MTYLYGIYYYDLWTSMEWISCLLDSRIRGTGEISIDSGCESSVMQNIGSARVH